MSAVVVFSRKGCNLAKKSTWGIRTADPSFNFTSDLQLDRKLATAAKPSNIFDIESEMEKKMNALNEGFLFFSVYFGKLGIPAKYFSPNDPKGGGNHLEK